MVSRHFSRNIVKLTILLYSCLLWQGRIGNDFLKFFVFFFFVCVLLECGVNELYVVYRRYTHVYIDFF